MSRSPQGQRGDLGVVDRTGSGMRKRWPAADWGNPGWSRAPCTLCPCILCPCVLGPSVWGPCVLGPCILGPSVWGPCILGPSVWGPCVLSRLGYRSIIPWRCLFLFKPSGPCSEATPGGINSNVCRNDIHVVPVFGVVFTYGKCLVPCVFCS